MLGIAYPLLFILPGSDHGHVEDAYDTFVMIENSPHLACLIVLYLFSCGTYNASGIAVTGVLSATHRQMMDASRTSVIWAFGLTVHYFINPSSPYGEALTSWSALQLIGFFVLVGGQSVYGAVLKVPGL